MTSESLEMQFILPCLMVALPEAEGVVSQNLQAGKSLKRTNPFKLTADTNKCEAIQFYCKQTLATDRLRQPVLSGTYYGLIWDGPLFSISSG